MSKNAETAIKLVQKYFDSMNITVDTPSIEMSIKKWEALLDPIDVYTLAAISIENPPHNLDLTIPALREIKELYFPE